MNERYHTISLVAVFLALAAGMVIGALFLQSPALNTTRSQYSKVLGRVNQLTTDYNKTREQLDETRSQLSNVASAFDHLVDKVVAGRLKNRNVAIIQYGEYPEAAIAAAQSLKLAGAEVTVSIVLDPSLLKQDNWQQVFAKLSNIPNGVDITSLRQIKGVSIRSEADYVTPTRLVVIVGGHKESLIASISKDDFESALIDAMHKQEMLTLVGAEALSASQSSIPLFIEKNIPSIDCVDLSIGQITLPFLFQEENGAYGVKKTASAIMPDSAKRAF